MVTVVGPSGNVVPAAGDCVITSEPAAVQLSVATTPVVRSGIVPVQLVVDVGIVAAGAHVVITGAV